MSSTTKIIKYFAIALASVLIVSIITGGVFLINSIFGLKTNDDSPVVSYQLDATLSDYLEIDLKATNLIIENNDTFSIQTNNDYIKVTNREGKLVIKEERKNYFNNKTYVLRLNLPDIIFNEIEIDAGAGTIEINNLNVLELSLDLGAGKVVIDNLNVTNEISIDDGAGEINLTKSNLTNLDLVMGVGKCTINSILVGNSEIDAGVGELNLNLIDNNYRFKVNKGVGKISLNNQELKNNGSYGTGINNLFIDGGVGNINITTNNT